MEHDLPQELIIQILLRLPVKSLVRFKCVCKSWLSLISDPHFALSHYHLAAARTRRLVLFVPSASKFLSMDVDASLLDDSAYALLSLDFLPSQLCSKVKIIGFCRGFVLLKCGPNLYVWNPSTGAYKGISLSVNALLFPRLYVFGYDAATDDYLVVLATCGRNSADDWATCVELYSLRGNTWEEIEDTYVPDVKSDDLGLLFNDAIHWLGFSQYEGLIVIVAFDLMERSFSEIPLPHEVDNSYYDDDYFRCELREFGGLLSLYVEGGRDQESWSGIWVMEEYKVHSSWTMIVVTPTDDFFLKHPPLCWTKSADSVRIKDTGLVKYDCRGQIKEHRSYCDNSLEFRVAVYTESLLSPQPQQVS